MADPAVSDYEFGSRAGNTYKNQLGPEETKKIYGFYPGDVVRCSKAKKSKTKIGIVRGVYKNDLFFYLIGDTGASKWSDYKKEMFEQKKFKLIYSPYAAGRQEGFQLMCQLLQAVQEGKSKEGVCFEAALTALEEMMIQQKVNNRLNELMLEQDSFVCMGPEGLIRFVKETKEQ
jgi:hypothetical protein